ncbi:hypothetical protein [Microbulbifer sp. SSSA002]|uniref:hypothetical protein n=1 Tax=unclassified Microbulbifer TaxID=2619833 RepID=UPI00403981CA
MSQLEKIAVLFARQDSNYKSIEGVDVWDAERDARRWPGGSSLIAHPPCRLWGRLRQFAKGSEDEKELAIFAIGKIQKWGGVLEHPAYSTLWKSEGLPLPGSRDQFDGWTLPVHQHWWGHRAEKATWLYVVGVEPKDMPEIPLVLGKATHCIRPTKSYPRLPSVTKAEREHTPIDFAHWLVEVARRAAGYSKPSQEAA